MNDRPAESPRLVRGSAAVMLLGVAAWLWPIGLGGRMPIGGDVTRFSLGLMAVLGRAYRELRLPLWNDLWGYGFPGLAESQMGVYYPPHILLYGLLPTEAAYTVSLVLHTFWAALGAFWAARRFGAAAWGAALGGFAWAACGFFLIHLPHQWGYTVGSWMPWAWGLAWPMAQGRTNLQSVPLLALVLALQVLPGHFQLAFITEVGVLGLALWGLVERPAGWRAAVGGSGGIVLALAAIAPLDALQLLPTFELARLAESRRDFEYLSGFAATPLHLVSYVAPGLFHRSPLWRPVVWDPFHTSPEEHMATVGLAPLVLALGCLRGWKRDPAVRALGWLAAGSLALSFGPYLPGFPTLIRLPGFSFFRAPARWGLATELALALLAAKGLTALIDRAWPRPARGITLAGLLAVAVVMAAVGLAELALSSLRQPAQGWLASSLEGAMAWTPWPATTTLRASLSRILRPPDDPLILAGLWRRGEDPSLASLMLDRSHIYREELLPAGIAVAGLIAGAWLLARRPAALASWLLALTAAELVFLGQTLRPVETAPARSLSGQSPILRAMEQLPAGTRVADGQGNLAMLVGKAPLPPYRTLDRPMLGGFTSTLDESPVVLSSGRLEIGRLLGVGLHVYSQLETPGHLRGGAIPAPWQAPIPITDTELARWNYGSKGLELLGPLASEFRYWPAPYRPARAWLMRPPATQVAELPRYLPQTTPGGTIEPAPGALVPLVARSPVPERIEIEVDADPETEQAGSVLLTVLDDPEWEITWTPRGAESATPIAARREGGAFGAIRVAVPEPGRWTLRLVYRGKTAYRGLVVSMVSWMAWAALFAGAWRLGRQRRKRIEANAQGQAT